MKNAETAGKVIKKYDVNNFQTSDGKEGKVGSVMIGDETGRIRVTFWHDMTDKLEQFNENDIIKVRDAYVRVNNNRVELHMNARSKLFVNPEGVTIGEVKEYTSNRKKVKDLKEGDENVEILGTIVQAFEPRFFEVCPECNRRAKPTEGEYRCNTHGSVDPKYSFVMNVQVDDGTGNIRIVCFRNQAKSLLKKEDNDILAYKDAPGSFEEVKQELLGEFVKIVGRVTKNKMFDREEMISQLVFRDPDPEKELNQ
ncbi:MAG: OB-fold nucleic acid binding domain-containing protein [Nanobdellota archaeon]